VTARTTATNGVGSGTSSSGSRSSSAVATTACGTDRWLSPTPNPIAATPAAATDRT
jgi:hypothetical protein